ncbi:glyoxylate reductase/hydroxypyruvate reductase [Frankliniella occidentalis]|uniref:Glyoxylate reductase/hydroxypyruvate reductase n=1 Tax=Frankliniella occidentalis TaxID=133901 RepID=A0A6J1S308_FRAOC|nr:glyoxylate reductase/hydroxypyruvate reductase [Frankliniella occidentalis]
MVLGSGTQLKFLQILRHLHHCRRYSKIMRPSVYVTRPDVPAVGIDLLKEKCSVHLWTGNIAPPRDELLKGIIGKNALFCNIADKIDKDVFDAAGSNLKVVATMSVGYEHIDLEEAKKRGIKVGYTPDVLTYAVAELTVGILLATSRRLFEAHREIFTGGWTSWSPSWMCGPSIRGKTVGIVGFGRIGQETARLLKGFGVKQFLYSGRKDHPEASDIGALRLPIEEMLPQCDFVICALALTPETKHFFNEKLFNLMKPSTIFVNTSRGGVVDQDALIKALETGVIRGAGLDVMTPEPIPSNHRLLSLPNCVVIPHIGSAGIESRNDMAELTARNILTALENKPMPAELKL